MFYKGKQMGLRERYKKACIRRDRWWSPGMRTYTDEDFDNFMEEFLTFVVLGMKETKLLFEERLFYYDEDGGVFLRVFYDLWLDKEMKRMRKRDPLRALAISGAYVFGTGAIFAMESLKLDKSLPAFTEEEREAVFSKIGDREPYGLMLELQGIGYAERRKQCLDALFVDAVYTMEELARDLINDKDYQREYMSILFNAGLSYILRYEERV